MFLINSALLEMELRVHEACAPAFKLSLPSELLDPKHTAYPNEQGITLSMKGRHVLEDLW